jgi:hypothetical protein
MAKFAFYSTLKLEFSYFWLRHGNEEIQENENKEGIEKYKQQNDIPPQVV